MIEKVRIYGEVTVTRYQSNKRFDKLIKKSIEFPSKMNGEDWRKLKELKVQEDIGRNLLLPLFSDRCVELVGYTVGNWHNLFTDYRNRLTQMNVCNFPLMVSVNAGVCTTPGWETFFPELIKLGLGNTTPTILDTDLDIPVDETLRNTHNSKFGGVESQAYKTGLGFRWDNIAKYNAIYLSDEFNNLEAPITEVGLFLPYMDIGHYYVDDDGYVLFNCETPLAPGEPTRNPNTFWSVLNVFVMLLDGGNWEGHVLNQQQIDANRESQRIYCDVGSIDAGTARALVIFTPRYDCVGTVWHGWMGEFGTNLGFDNGRMVARRVMPVSFVKNPNHTLTVTWQIFFDRGE